MSGTIVAFDHVTHAWPRQGMPAIRDESWDLAPGAFALVIGPSGSGKSSLLRCVNGLIPHFSGGRFAGSVIVDGVNTRQAGPRAMSRQVSFVFQDPESQSVASRVDDDIAFGLEQLGIDRATMRMRVESSLDMLNLAHLRRRSPATLSGGERQRLALAGALAMRPPVLVLDEPTSQLDPWAADDLIAVLQRINADHGITIVIAEHRTERLLPIVDVVRSMRAGNPSKIATPREVAACGDVTPLPPIVRLGRALGVEQPPLTVREARTTFASLAVSLESRQDVQASPGDFVMTAQRLRVEPGGQRVIDKLDLTIAEGELVAVIGRNGSGKTTLLRTIAGLQPFSGRLTTLGHDMGQARPQDFGGKVGYVPQQAMTLFHEERLRDAMADAGGVDPHHSTIDEGLRRFDLAGKGDTHPLDLSGGEREAAALSTVMMARPRLLLLDEPTRGMDAWRKHSLANQLRAIRESGTAIVMATHDMELLAECATRVVMLGDGGVVADGPPRSILDGSLAYTTQVNAVFGKGYLTVEDVLSGISTRSA